MLPGLVQDLTTDIVPLLVAHRKQTTDPAERVLANAWVSGTTSRFDRFKVGKGRVEKPGPYCTPMATNITAGVRLLLVGFDKMLGSRGGTPVYGDQIPRSSRLSLTSARS